MHTCVWESVLESRRSDEAGLPGDPAYLHHDLLLHQVEAHGHDGHALEFASVFRPLIKAVKCHPYQQNVDGADDQLCVRLRGIILVNVIVPGDEIAETCREHGLTFATRK